MPSTYQPTRHHAPAKRLVAAGLVITLGFSVVCWAVMARIATRDLEKTKQAAANVIATIASDISRNLEVYDLSLQAVVDGTRIPGVWRMSPQLRDVILFDRAATAKDLGAIFVLDGAGRVVVDSRSESLGKDYSGADWFTVHEKDANAGRYISRPWTSDKGEQLISISRRITDDDGEMIGVVAGTLRLSYFHGLFQRVQKGEGDVLTLTKQDGTLLMRSPLGTGNIGRNLTGSSVFERVRATDSGTFEEVAAIDGTRRLYIHQRVEDTPLFIVNGLSTSRIYAGWWREAWLIGSLMTVLCAMNVALFIFLARALKKRSDAEYQVALQAVTDALTGLNNRRQFDKVIESEWGRARRAQLPVAVLMIDADRFKDYNDTFGHQRGDAALAAIADCMKAAAARTSDFCARYGGEEFAVVLPGETVDGAMTVAERIRANVNALRAEQADQADKTPTVSIGVASLVPRAGLSTRDLIHCADRALYQAKELGRDRCVAAPAQLQPKRKKIAA